MLSNPLSIIILIFSAALILGAIFSKGVRKANAKQVAALKEHEESLSTEEKINQKKTQTSGVFLIEIFFWLCLLVGALYGATKV